MTKRIHDSKRGAPLQSTATITVIAPFESSSRDGFMRLSRRHPSQSQTSHESSRLEKARVETGARDTQLLTNGYHGCATVSQFLELHRFLVIRLHQTKPARRPPVKTIVAERHDSRVETQVSRVAIIFKHVVVGHLALVGDPLNHTSAEYKSRPG